MEICQINKLSIKDVIMMNELSINPKEEINNYLDLIDNTMNQCI